MRTLSLALSLSLSACGSTAFADDALLRQARNLSLGADICAAHVSRDKSNEELVRSKIHQYFSEAKTPDLLNLFRPYNQAATGYAGEAPQIRLKSEIIGSILNQQGFTFARLRDRLLLRKEITPEQAEVLTTLGDRSVLIFTEMSSSTSGMGIYSPGSSEFSGFSLIRKLPGLTVVEIPSDNSLSSGSSWGGRYGISSEYAIFPADSERYNIANMNMLRPRLLKDLAAKLEDPKILDRFVERIYSDVSEREYKLEDPLSTKNDFMDRRQYIRALVILVLWQDHVIEFNKGGHILPIPRLRSRPFFYYRSAMPNTLEIIYERETRGIADSIAGQLGILRDRLLVTETGELTYGPSIGYTQATIHIGPSNSGDQ